MLHNDRLNSRLVRSNNLLDLFAILEENKCWHSSHFQLCGNFGMLVHVDFVEACVGVGIRQLDDLRGDGLARTTPGCKGINHQEARLLNHIFILLAAARKVSWSRFTRSGTMGEIDTEEEDQKDQRYSRKKLGGTSNGEDLEKTYEVMLWTPILNLVC